MPDYTIKGVCKETGHDTELVISAESEANAKVKADMRGVHVTEVNWPRDTPPSPVQAVPLVDHIHPTMIPATAGQAPVIVNVTQSNVMHAAPGSQFSPLLAAFLSFLIPGLGQLYKGQPINGIVWFIVVLIGYAAFIIPGLVLHLCCIIGAASGKR